MWQHQRHVDEVAAAMLERVALPPWPPPCTCWHRFAVIKAIRSEREAVRLDPDFSVCCHIYGLVAAFGFEPEEHAKIAGQHETRQDSDGNKNINFDRPAKSCRRF